MREEAREEHARDEAGFRNLIFASDMHNKLRIYKQMFKEQQEQLEMEPDEIEDIVPESPEDAERMLNELRRAGVFG